MSEHTPGPWEVVRLHLGQTKGLHVKQTLPIGEGLYLATHTFDGKQAEANMKLMAAAPELYSALQASLEQVELLQEFPNDDKESSDYNKSVIKQAKEALKKARVG